MVTWDLHRIDKNPNRADIRATIENDIFAQGDNIVPLLCMKIKFDKFGDDISLKHVPSSQIMAISIELIPSGNSSQAPWVSTGLQPTGEVENKVSVPLNHAIIEELSRQAEYKSDYQVKFMLKLSIMKKEPETEKTNIYVSMDSEIIHIHAAKWLNLCKQWGYPAKRIVPLSLELPNQLETENDEAAKAWDIACKHLLEAHEKWKSVGKEEAGGKLRDALQYAIFTWYSLWYKESIDKIKKKKTFDILKKIGEGIPSFNPDKFYVDDKKNDPDIERPFSRLIMLKDLNTLTNTFHHVGESLVYLSEDIDVLLSSTTSVLRSLPSFWDKYPQPFAKNE